MQPVPDLSLPPRHFRRPEGNWEDLRRMEDAEGECRRSAERLRFLFAALAVGVAPLVIAVLAGLASLIPAAGEWLSAVFDVLVVVSFVVLVPAQFVVIHKASNSMRLRDSDRFLIALSCAFFSVAPIITFFVLKAWLDF